MSKPEEIHISLSSEEDKDLFKRAKLAVQNEQSDPDVTNIDTVRHMCNRILEEE